MHSGCHHVVLAVYDDLFSVTAIGSSICLLDFQQATSSEQTIE
jgi:hypothetical protein